MRRLAAALALFLMPLAACSSPDGGVVAHTAPTAEPDVSGWQTWVLP